MDITESTWKQGKYEIYTRSWPVEPARAVVCLIHGMGEHCGRYDHVAKEMNRHGIAVCAYDQIGHGKSAGKRGHAPSLDFLLDSVTQLIDRNSIKYPNIPLFIYGHSMGGNVALNYILRRKPSIAGAIITSPWITLALEPPFFQLWLGKLMYNLYPAFSDHSKLDASAISRDANEVRKYQEDPLVHDYVTPGYFFPLHYGGQWILENASNLQIPMMLFHGTEDKITSIESTRSFAENTGKLATFRAWEGGYHELHNDLDRNDFIAAMIQFIEGQTAHKD